MKLTSISHYRLEERVGKGTFGEVYRAYDLQSSRYVAIKFIRHLGSTPMAIKRFSEEAKVVAAISHPNVVRIHEVGESEGAPYLVTEYVEGESLAGRIALGPLLVDQIIEIVVQIAAGLTALHERNIVHGDLKPSNIIITPGGQLKILDFAFSSPHTEPGQTGSDRVSDVSGYRAPEQIRGSEVDTRADIFSLGAILYKMVTGIEPQAIESNAKGATIPSGRLLNLSKQKDSVPDFLEFILWKSLQRRPEARFQSIAEVLQALPKNESALQRIRARATAATFDTFSWPFSDSATVAPKAVPSGEGTQPSPASILGTSSRQLHRRFAASMLGLMLLIVLAGLFALGGTVLGFGMIFGGSLLAYECYLLLRASK